MTIINFSLNEIIKANKFLNTSKIKYPYFYKKRIIHYLKKKLIDKLANFYYIFHIIKELKFNYNKFGKNCIICFAYINNPIFLHCGHYYHQKCILKWLKLNENCPQCRALIL